MKEQQKRTEVSDLGEFGLIERLTKNNETKNFSTILAVGDDAALLNHNGKDIVVSSDMLVEGVHFDLTYSPLKYLGYKSVVVNLSDIYAMNAFPKQITYNIAISNKMSVEALDELYEGVYEACDKYQVDLVGGDTTTSLSGLILSITAIGEVNEQVICFRKGARVNDIICVTGDLGAAYLGLLFLEREKDVYKTTQKQPTSLANNQYLIRRFLRPEARKDIIEFFEEKTIVPTSMIDISDGLSSELIHICTKNKVSCEVFEDKIPYDPNTLRLAEEMNLELYTSIMSGGEDYELLFTLDQKDYDNIKNSKSITPIGYITDIKKNEKPCFITSSGNKKELTALGWEAF